MTAASFETEYRDGAGRFPQQIEGSRLRANIVAGLRTATQNLAIVAHDFEIISGFAHFSFSLRLDMVNSLATAPL